MNAKKTERGRAGVAIVNIDERKRPPARAAHFRTYPYPAGFRARLLAATADERVGLEELSALNFELGRAFGRAAISVARVPAILGKLTPPPRVS